MPKAFEERHHGARPDKLPQICQERRDHQDRDRLAEAKCRTHNRNGYRREPHTERSFDDAGDEKRNDDRCDSVPFQRFEH